MLGSRSFLASLLLAFAAEADAVTIQALVDLDNDSEDLVKSLISKVDAIIDPKVIDSKNATQELAYALLRLGPLITVNGSISDLNLGLQLSFNFNAKAGVTALSQQVITNSVVGGQVDKQLKPEQIARVQNAVLQEIADFLEPYLLGAASIVLNGIVANIIAHLMNEISLLSNTNIC